MHEKEKVFEIAELIKECGFTSEQVRTMASWFILMKFHFDEKQTVSFLKNFKKRQEITDSEGEE